MSEELSSEKRVASMVNIEALIAEVYKRTSIWDKREKSHSNRNMLDKCWKEIGKKMDVDGNLLRKKWKYLRDQYSVELGKISAVRSGDAATVVRTSKWPYFYSLSFLKDTVKARKSKGNCSMKLTDEQMASVETEDAGPSDEWQPPLFEYVDLTADQEVVQQPVNEDQIIEDQRRGQKRKISQIEAYEMENIEKENLEFVREKTEKTNLEDEDLFFFKSLLSHVRRIPPSSKLAFRGRIQEVVDEFAYRKRPISTSPHSCASSTLSLSFPTLPDIRPISSPVPNAPHSQDNF